MKLLYFAVEGFCQNDGFTEFNFDSNLRFKYLNGRLSVSCFDVLSDSFFTNSVDKHDVPVESVSVIVGENGIGKTTIAHLLSEVFSGEAHISRDEFDDSAETENPYDDINNFNVHNYIAVLQMKKGVEKPQVSIATNMAESPLFDCEDVSILEKFKFNEQPIKLADHCKMIYHTPVFSFHQAIVEHDPAVIDISTRRKLEVREEDIESRDVSGCQTSGWLRAMVEENKRVISFLSKIKMLDLNLRFPIPHEVSCDVESEAIGHAMKDFSDTLRGCQGEDDLKWVLRSEDDFGKTLIAYILDAFSSPTNKSPFGFASEEIKEKFLSMFVPFARQLKAANTIPDRMGGTDVRGVLSQPSYRPCFLAYQEIMDDLKDFLKSLDANSYGLFENDRSRDNLESGVRMFYLLAKRICRNHREYASGKMCFQIKDDDDLEFIGEVNDCYDSCKGQWSISYFYLGFGLSAGEMSFVTLFSRLYECIGRCYDETSDNTEDNNYIVYLDESETTLHPDLQRHIVEYLVDFFENLFPKSKVHIVLATHSPILLSDIPHGNVVKLQWDEGRLKRVVSNFNGSSFAANIFDLYRESFFLKKGTMGEFAKGKVDQLLKKLNPPRPDTSKMSTDEIKKAAEEYQRKLREITINPDDLKVARLIGDPFLSRYVWRRLEELNKDYDTPEDEQGGEGNGDRS